MKRWSVAILLIQLAAFQAPAQSAGGTDFQQAEKQFDQLCAGCHGEGGAGGDRAPALINNRELRSRQCDADRGSDQEWHSRRHAGISVT